MDRKLKEPLPRPPVVGDAGRLSSAAGIEGWSKEPERILLFIVYPPCEPIVDLEPALLRFRKLLSESESFAGASSFCSLALTCGGSGRRCWVAPFVDRSEYDESWLVRVVNACSLVECIAAPADDADKPPEDIGRMFFFCSVPRGSTDADCDRADG